MSSTCSRFFAARCQAPLLVPVVLALCSAVCWAEIPKIFAVWEPAIRRFEEEDKQKPPIAGGVLFLGSSSIRRWDTAADFPKAHVVNRGFGGSRIADSTHFAERIVIPHKPRLIVFYAGDNDIAAGHSAETVLADFKEFVTSIHEKLPQTRIAFVAIKPSLKRIEQLSTQTAANTAIADYIRTDERLQYVDVVQPMLGTDGRPRVELFDKDGLHLSAEGYQLWVKLVRPLLQENEPPAK